MPKLDGGAWLAAQGARQLHGPSGPLELTGVRLDSRQVQPGDLFVALTGSQTNGWDFVPQAIERGARAILASQPAPDSTAALSVPIWIHPEARRLVGLLAAERLGHPSRELEVVAITGTNGKTTTAHMLRSLLQAGGESCALLGTTGYHLAGGQNFAATHTTPDAPRLQQLLGLHRQAGGGTVIMEASSHAIDQDRLAGTEIDLAVFTNLGRDHLDYHGTLEAYAASKAALFASLGHGGAAVLNADDQEHPRMAGAAASAGAQIVTTSLLGPADLWATHVAMRGGQIHFDLQGMGLNATGLVLPMVGEYNLSNLLQALASARWLGAEAQALLAAIPRVQGAPGRMERVPLGPGRPAVFVDFAHTPEGLQVALEALASIEPRGQLTVVFGCGGDRDRGKRAPMGQVAARLADRVLITSDNPRSEDPVQIAAGILAGVQTVRGLDAPEYFVELDRRAAIGLALRHAEPEDVILVAGKGHEAQQIFADQTVPFDDRQVVMEVGA